MDSECPEGQENCFSQYVVPKLVGLTYSAEQYEYATSTKPGLTMAINGLSL